MNTTTSTQIRDQYPRLRGKHKSCLTQEAWSLAAAGPTLTVLKDLR